MNAHQSKRMNSLACPKGHQGIFLNGKPFCLECKCPIESQSKAEPQEQAEREPRDEGPRNTGQWCPLMKTSGDIKAIVKFIEEDPFGLCKTHDGA